MPQTNPPADTILLDIEGTTTPVSFVYQALFPYARKHVKEFLARNLSSEEVRSELVSLREEHASALRRGLNVPPLVEHPQDALLESLTTYIHWLMDADSKSTPLKSLQGKVWEEGYRTGELRGEVFEDVLPAFGRWRRRGIDISIFSSGSVNAQKLLFSHAAGGDLTPFITAYFDTTIGAKKDPSSYSRIASALSRQPARILFISDTVSELDAAHASGMQTLLCLRPGCPPPPDPFPHKTVHTFGDVIP
jgi:enolase-phosphatase E1